MTVISLAPDAVDRVQVTYTCPQQHEFSLVFAADAAIPPNWDCPRCGQEATTEHQPAMNQAPQPGRTHWDMVLERRTMDELYTIATGRINHLREISRV
ncbi:MAG: RNA polymerase-binding protein RbpA [Propionibacteriaceae bacterium]|nr:RNA polymerase-binding protein RbpA [Propionibacteriaceae bacterium]